jgi:6-phosphogluconolactonase
MRHVEILDDPEALAQRAASLIIQAAAEAVTARERFTIAVSGGSTPQRTNELLAGPQNAARIDWDKLYLFFGDERDVAPDDPRSNYAMVRRTLLAHVPIPAGNVFPIIEAPASPSPFQGEDRGEVPGDPAAVAERYIGVLRGFFSPSSFPRFDLIVLGMGDDGHCASLFPGNPSLDVHDKWVVASPPGVLPPPVDRVTVTLPVINAARQVLFLVAGDRKAEAVQDIFERAAPPFRRPSAGVAPAGGVVTWLLDKAAASMLSK